MAAVGRFRWGGTLAGLALAAGVAGIPFINEQAATQARQRRVGDEAARKAREGAELAREALELQIESVAMMAENAVANPRFLAALRGRVNRDTFADLLATESWWEPYRSTLAAISYDGATLAFAQTEGRDGVSVGAIVQRVGGDRASCQRRDAGPRRGIPGRGPPGAARARSRGGAGAGPADRRCVAGGGGPRTAGGRGAQRREARARPRRRGQRRCSSRWPGMEARGDLRASGSPRRRGGDRARARAVAVGAGSGDRLRTGGGRRRIVRGKGWCGRYRSGSRSRSPRCRSARAAAAPRANNRNDRRALLLGPAATDLNVTRAGSRRRGPDRFDDRDPRASGSGNRARPLPAGRSDRCGRDGGGVHRGLLRGREISAAVRHQAAARRARRQRHRGRPVHRRGERRVHAGAPERGAGVRLRRGGRFVLPRRGVHRRARSRPHHDAPARPRRAAAVAKRDPPPGERDPERARVRARQARRRRAARSGSSTATSRPRT